MAKKVFLSPSDQSGNTYNGVNTTEQIQCERLANYAKIALVRSGVEVKVAVNDKVWKTEHVTASNNWKPDLHVAIHTNASGASNYGKAHGTQVYYGVAGVDKARRLYNAVNNAFPVEMRYAKEFLDNSKTGVWSEFYNVTAPVLYLETNFHDNKSVAQYIVANSEKIGEAIAKGICDVLDVPYKSPAPVAVDKATDEAEKVAIEMNKDTPTRGIATGDKLDLKNEPLFYASASKERAGTVTGTYYVWSSIPVNGRIRITITKSRVGITGQVTGWINLPSNVVYTVKSGDTLSAIASKYGTTVKRIAEDNKIENVNLIKTGQKLEIKY